MAKVSWDTFLDEKFSTVAEDFDFNGDVKQQFLSALPFDDANFNRRVEEYAVKDKEFYLTEVRERKRSLDYIREATKGFTDEQKVDSRALHGRLDELIVGAQNAEHQPTIDFLQGLKSFADSNLIVTVDDLIPNEDAAFESDRLSSKISTGAEEFGKSLGGEAVDVVGKAVENISTLGNVLASKYGDIRFLTTDEGGDFKLFDVLSSEEVKQRIQEQGTYSDDVIGNFGTEIQNLADDIKGDIDQNTIASKVGSVTGQLLAFIGAGAASRTLGVGTAVLSGGEYQLEDYENALLEEGNKFNEGEAANVAILGNAIGSLESVPAIKALGRIIGGKSTPQLLKWLDTNSGGAFNRFIKNAVPGATEEGLQEATSQLLSNLVAKDIVQYDKDRDLFVGTLESAEVGAGAGAILNGLLGVLSGNRKIKSVATGDATQVVTLEQVDGESDAQVAEREQLVVNEMADTLNIPVEEAQSAFDAARQEAAVEELADGVVAPIKGSEFLTAPVEQDVIANNGLTKVLYHGTNTKLSNIDIYGNSAFGLFGTGFYTTDNPEVALGYAEGRAASGRRKGDDVSLERVVVTSNNPLNMDDQPNLSAWESIFRNVVEVDKTEFNELQNGKYKSYIDGGGLNTNSRYFELLTEMMHDAHIIANESGDIVVDAFKRAGFDSIVHKDIDGYVKSRTGKELEHEVTIVFDNEQVRLLNDSEFTSDSRQRASQTNQQTISQAVEQEAQIVDQADFSDAAVIGQQSTDVVDAQGDIGLTIKNNVPLIKRIVDVVAPFPTSSTSKTERAVYAISSLFSNFGNVPTSFGRIIRDGKYRQETIEGQFDRLAQVLTKQLDRSDKGATYSDLSTLALAGDKAALRQLPKNIQNTVTIARDNFDQYTQAIVDNGYVEKGLASKLKDNLGKYLLRQYKVFDPEYNWDNDSVKKNDPAIYKAATDEIMATTDVTRLEAEEAISVMLDPARSEGVINGATKAGKIDIRSFIKKKDLSAPIRAVLGEITNPIENIKSTGVRVSDIYTSYETQRELRSAGLKSGYFSLSARPDIRHTTLLGAEDSQPQLVIESKDGEVTKKLLKRKIKKQYAGFGEMYTTPEIAEAIDDILFNVKQNTKAADKALAIGAKIVTTTTSTGKFAQVILNPPAYATNLASAAVFELINGRLLINNKGWWGFPKGKGGIGKGLVATKRDIGANLWGFLTTDKGLNEATKLHTLQDKADLHAKIARDVDLNDISSAAFVTEMKHKGLVNRSVYGADFDKTTQDGYATPLKKYYMETLGRVPILKTLGNSPAVLSSTYQVPDNIGKYNAFYIELSKYKDAYPDKTMGEVIDLAAKATQMTTQNYDLVPVILRRLSQYGLWVPTYVSFSYELVRTTVNTSKLATQELASGNPVLQKAGARRMAGMMMVSAMLSSVTKLLPGDTEEEKEKARLKKEFFEDYLSPPWLEDKNLLVLQASDGQFRYADPSYMIPHNMFYNILTKVQRKEPDESIIASAFAGFFENFTDVNILTQIVSEVFSNKKANGAAIWKDVADRAGEEDKYEKIVEHVIDSGFTPGFIRTYDQIKKAKRGDIGYMGNMKIPADMYAQMVGLRPSTTNMKKAFRDEFRDISFDIKAAKAIVSKSKLIELSKTDQERYNYLLNQENVTVEFFQQKLIDFAVDATFKWETTGKDMQEAAKSVRLDKATKLKVYTALVDAHK